jgi:bifunctional DNA-binding transcriptional regulator/antitoxin component of YhaV-PrlF toxin-antitoxin module
MIYTLKSFNTGQITLPKVWRSKFNTKNFVAEEREDGLLIKPIENLNDSVYYENKDGFGIYSAE